MLNLKIIIGSTRPGRAADRVIPFITGAARAHGDLTVDVLNLRDWPVPLRAATPSPQQRRGEDPLNDLARWATALLKAAFSPMQRAGTRMLGILQFMRLRAERAGDSRPPGA